MKKQFLLLALLGLAVSSFAQQTTTKPPAVKTDYLKKSKTQKTIAWILAGSGAVLLVTTLATSADETANAILGDDSGLNSNATLFVIGGIATLSSIPLFIASGRNHRKAMSLSFKNEPALQIQQTGFVNKPVPSVALKISL